MPRASPGAVANAHCTLWRSCRLMAGPATGLRRCQPGPRQRPKVGRGPPLRSPTTSQGGPGSTFVRGQRLALVRRFLHALPLHEVLRAGPRCLPAAVLAFVARSLYAGASIRLQPVQAMVALPAIAKHRAMMILSTSVAVMLDAVVSGEIRGRPEAASTDGRPLRQRHD